MSLSWSTLPLASLLPPPPWLADPPGWLADSPPRDGWLGRSAFALTKRTCFCAGKKGEKTFANHYVACKTMYVVPLQLAKQASSIQPPCSHFVFHFSTPESSFRHFIFFPPKPLPSSTVCLHSFSQKLSQLTNFH